MEGEDVGVGIGKRAIFVKEKMANQPKVLSLERPKAGRQLGSAVGTGQCGGRKKASSGFWRARLERRGEER